MGAAMAVIGISGMVGMIGSSGYESGVSADLLRKQINDVDEITKNWQNKYNSMIQNQMALDDSIQTSMIEALDNYTKYQASIKLERDNFNEQYKKLQIFGVIFVATIFILLLLKQTELLKPLWNFITTPERKLYNYVLDK